MKDEYYFPLDPTTPWFEWISYLECCKSLEVEPSMTRFLRYHQYLKEVGIK
jgi:hypothetical protein